MQYQWVTKLLTHHNTHNTANSYWFSSENHYLCNIEQRDLWSTAEWREVKKLARFQLVTLLPHTLSYSIDYLTDTTFLNLLRATRPVMSWRCHIPFQTCSKMPKHPCMQFFHSISGSLQLITCHGALFLLRETKLLRCSSIFFAKFAIGTLWSSTSALFFRFLLAALYFIMVCE